MRLSPRFSLVLQSARHYWKSHLGLLAAAVLACAVINGSLLIGESVRASLRHQAAMRLGRVQQAYLGQDHFFTHKLAQGRGAAGIIAALGSAANDDGSRRLNRTQILGVDEAFWKLSASGKAQPLPKGALLINAALAKALAVKDGDTVILRLERPSAISRDAPLSGSTREEVTLRRKVQTLLRPEDFGDFQLHADALGVANAFVALDDLQGQLEMPGLINAALSAQSDDPATWDQAKSLADLGLRLTQADGRSKNWEISSPRIFLHPALAQKLLQQPDAYGVLTYLVNGLKSANGATPYSMVTAVDGLANHGADEITISQWLAEDQKLRSGDKLELTYFVVVNGRELQSQSASFRVRGIMPMMDKAITKAWTPQFPGVSDVDNCRDWEPGIPMDMKAIRDQDEQYWDQYGGTPKAFISLGAGQKLWANRFGNLTAVRLPLGQGDAATLEKQLLNQLKLADVGLRPQAMQRSAQAAAAGSVDFGGLFIGLSLFLMIAALLFAAMLFLFTLENRRAQLGLMLSVGLSPREARRMLLTEAAVIASLGCLLGLPAGALYTKAALQALQGAWSGATQGIALIFSGAAGIQMLALFIAWTAVMLTLWLQSRRLFAASPLQLLGGSAAMLEISAKPRPRRLLLPILLLAAALILLGCGAQGGSAQTVTALFFGAALLLLIGGLTLISRTLLRGGSQHQARQLSALALRNLARRPGRSLGAMGMMASGIFLVIAVNAFHLKPSPSTDPKGGCGGFTLMGESTLPIYEDLNSEAGREAHGLDEELLAGVRIVAMRMRPGDDASCLNLSRAQNPVLLAVNPKALEGRFAFATAQPWSVLTAAGEGLPAIADQATALWGLGKSVGDELAYPDASGKPVSLRLRALLSNSILQGRVLINEADYLRAWPNAAGYRFFLIEAKPEQQQAVAAHLTRQLQSRGMQIQESQTHLAALMAVQNTYIAIFSLLGGLGVLLGTVGLGVLVARHVLERRSELALLQALGFAPARIARMLLTEHAALLGLGLGLGALSALLAIWPMLSQGNQDLPLPWILTLTSATLLCGLGACALATVQSLRSPLLEALRHE